MTLETQLQQIVDNFTSQRAELQALLDAGTDADTYVVEVASLGIRYDEGNKVTACGVASATRFASQAQAAAKAKVTTNGAGTRGVAVKFADAVRNAIKACDLGLASCDEALFRASRKPQTTPTITE